MRGLALVPYNTKIDFVGMRYIVYAFSILIILLSFGSLMFKGLNLGIDFKGGFLIEIRTSEKPDLAAMRSKLQKLELGEVKLQEFGDEHDLLIRIERQKGNEQAQAIALQKIKKTIGDNVDYRRVETVGAKVSQDLIQNGILAVIFALVGMLVYIWIRFEWHFGLCGILALIHDAIAVMGFYSLFNFEFNDTAFISILTTIGYSINDSVVIYDRIRENLRKYKKTPIADVINLSTNETLSRTILTVGTTVMSLLALCFFGGHVIRAFCIPILVGIVFGAFSSIFISANLLLFFNVRKKLAHAEEA
ncbi:preprotein translocase subunit SecF [Caedimonas varicaedens]|uniref:Protein-export membrane protein SecF n=1 Tax=Caedimonas varicaedens TaxID=1629334 RepID=A0A0K8MBH4_9PROT|nr:preprotein translocase subunit SecF [Caedimonas varicaedens]